MTHYQKSIKAAELRSMLERLRDDEPVIATFTDSQVARMFGEDFLTLVHLDALYTWDEPAANEWPA